MEDNGWKHEIVTTSNVISTVKGPNQPNSRYITVTSDSLKQFSQISDQVTQNSAVFGIKMVNFFTKKGSKLANFFNQTWIFFIYIFKAIGGGATHFLSLKVKLGLFCHLSIDQHLLRNRKSSSCQPHFLRMHSEPQSELKCGPQNCWNSIHFTASNQPKKSSISTFGPSSELSNFWN